jgi:hypothetical protein
MTINQLYKYLNHVNSSRESRTKYANMVLNDLNLIPKLIDILFMVDDAVSCKAAWVLEFVCDIKRDAIIPFLDKFTRNIHTIHLDSAVRPVAKICEFLAKDYYLEQDNSIKKALTPIYQERIIETCFDWMITDQKVAVKAYAMNTLFLLGKDFNWVHTELILILERDFHSSSAAFKARAGHIFKKIKVS